MLIVRRAKLYYAVSGIITLKQVSGLKLLKLYIEMHGQQNIKTIPFCRCMGVIAGFVAPKGFYFY